MKRLIFLAVFVLVFMTTSAQAQNTGLYVSGNIGLSRQPDFNGANTFFGAPIGLNARFDEGYKARGAVGYDFGVFRLEGEISYRYNDGDGLGSITTAPPAPVVSEISSISYLANVYYDYHSGNSPWIPYLGVGMGVSTVDFSFSIPSVIGGAIVNDKDTVLAFQIMVGVGYEVTQHLAVNVDYNYLGTSDVELRANKPPLLPAAGDNFKSSNSNHSFNLGIRYTF
jgi:opacity protein-like surface antigen